MRLILASASPRRAELLTSAGYTFETMVVPVDESVREGESPADYVRRLAAEKSAAVAKAIGLEGRDRREGTRTAEAESLRSRPRDTIAAWGASGGGAPRAVSNADALVLAADTTVVIFNEMLGKPVDDHDARRMLTLLSGRSHVVMTGVSVRGHEWESGLVEQTTVWFAPLGNADVEWYVQTGEGRDKAGAYAIQGRAARFIPRIDGSYSNVVGLPVEAVHRLILTAVASAE